MKTFYRNRRMLLGVFVALLLLCTAGCLRGDDKMVSTEVSLPEAKQRVDAELKDARIPNSFTPEQAVQRHTTWGAEARMIEVAFTAPRDAVDPFLAELSAHNDGVYQDIPRCTSPPPGQDSAAVPPSYSNLGAWYDRGVFDRCTATQSWAIPQSELTESRAIGGIYRQDAEDHAVVKVLIWVTVA